MASKTNDLKQPTDAHQWHAKWGYQPPPSSELPKKPPKYTNPIQAAPSAPKPTQDKTGG